MKTLEDAYAVFANPRSTYTDMLAAQSFIDANEKLAPVRGLIAPEEGYTYGDIVPLRTNQATGERELTVPMMAREGAQSLLNIAEGTQTGVVNPEDVMNVMPMGGAASLLDEGIEGGFTAGMFVGRSNLAADPDKFKRAEEMFQRGDSPEKIHAETGIYYGRDMQPRQEFSDVGALDMDVIAKGLKEVTESPGGAYSIPFSSVVSSPTHRMMFGALGAPRIKFMYDSEAKSNLDTGGYYSPQTNTVVLNQYRPSMTDPRGYEPAGTDDIASVLLHELEHGIQRSDGLTTGASPENAMRRYTEFGMDVEASPVVQEAKRKLDAMDSPRSELRDVNNAELSKFFQNISVSDNATRMAKYVFNDPTYQSNRQEILSQLGMPPKKPLRKRNEWLNKAADILSSKYAGNVQSKELLDLDRRQLKNLSNRVYRKAYPKDSFDTNAVRSASDMITREINNMFMSRGDTDFNAYRRKLGEQEARAVQARRNMTQEELEARFPEMDYSNPSQSWLDSPPTTARGLLHLTRER